MARYPIVGSDCVRVIARPRIVHDTGLFCLEQGQRGMLYISYPNDTAGLYIPSPNSHLLAHHLRLRIGTLRAQGDTEYAAEISMSNMSGLHNYFASFAPKVITTLTCTASPAIDRVRTFLRHHDRARFADPFASDEYSWYRVVDAQGQLAEDLKSHTSPFVTVKLGRGQITYALATRRFARTLRASGFIVYHIPCYRYIQQLEAPKAPLLDFACEENLDRARQHYQIKQARANAYDTNAQDSEQDKD